MPKFKVMINCNGDEEFLMEDYSYDDAIFDSEEDAKNAGLEACNASRLGSETLHMHNPGDYSYDEDEYEVDYEVVEIDD